MYEFLAWRVADAMSTDVVAIAPDATLADAEAIFDARDFDALPVIGDDGVLAGILSKLDVLRAYHFTPDAIVPRYDAIRLRPVAELMSLQPLTIGPAAPLTRVLETLVATRVKSLPVVADGRLVGMVSREDVLRALRSAAAGASPAR